MHDAKNRELKVGDLVLIPARVTSLSPSIDYCNLSASSIYGRKPDGSKETFSINTAVTLRANTGDVNDTSDFDPQGSALTEG